jgi:flavorubredoxin
MWYSTAKIAQSIGEGLIAGGVHPKLMPLKSNHRSNVTTGILDAGALLVGSPTLNNNMYPTIADDGHSGTDTKTQIIEKGAFKNATDCPTLFTQHLRTLQGN